MFIYNKSIIFKTLLASMTLFLATSCYDLDEMNKNPYELPDNSVSGGDTDTGDDGTKYNDLNLNFEVTKEDSAAYKIDLMAASSTFRNFLYEGYYAEYQITTNLSHDIYAGYVANNQPKHAKSSPDYKYADGWSGKRWSEFYQKRSAEYRTLLRSFKFNETPERYTNMFYITRIYYAFLALANTDTYGDMPFKEYVQARIPETNNVKY